MTRATLVGATIYISAAAWVLWLTWAWLAKRGED